MVSQPEPHPVKKPQKKKLRLLHPLDHNFYCEFVAVQASAGQVVLTGSMMKPAKLRATT